ncbi:LysR family transcriptional regulator [Comamonas sp.]|uniref:LysR family transcriptional regulator n=1 Tax=Comamonas sp. TaxID=34028 RepID=UPI003A9321C5
MSDFTSSRSFLRQIDLASLDLFVLICEFGSIARAAEHGGMVASAVSKRIAELESLARTPLLLRHARGVLPTPAGQLLLEHARTILLGVEHLRDDLIEYARGVRGLVRLSANASAVEQFLPEHIAVFARLHPDIRIDLRQATSRTVARAVRDHIADLGVCSHSDEAEGLESMPYRRERMVLITPGDHPLVGRQELAYEEALDYAQIGLRDSSIVQEMLDKEARAGRRMLRQRIEVDSLSAMCRMIECGLGVGVMPEGAYQRLGEARHLHAVALSDAWAERSLNLYATRFADLTAPARHFAAALMQEK